MDDLNLLMQEYKHQLDRGTLQKAYRGLMDYVMGLRTHLHAKYPNYAISGGIYYGFMDMTYFSFQPDSLSRRQLKVAIVFIHQTCQFELWLAAANKQVQSSYWQLIRDAGWDQYRLVPSIKGADAILEHILVANPDFADPQPLTAQIESGALQFIADVEGFLSQHAG
jgi:hypothetical protein